MRSIWLVSLVLLGASARVARAEEARPRTIWLECKAPAVWPARPGTPVRLDCRVDGPAPGPAFWQTVNPFRPDVSKDLMDPFEIVPRYLDVLETGRWARSKVTRPRPEPVTDTLMDPFEVFPDGSETINPFEPPRKEGPVERSPAR
jgi:hypothetical protein